MRQDVKFFVGWEDRVPGQGVCYEVGFAFAPLECERVWHEAFAHPEETLVFDFMEGFGEDSDQWPVVRDDVEGVSQEVVPGFSGGEDESEAFKFDGGVSGLAVR